MGTVFNRGTRGRPNWYVGYQEHGEWKYRPSHQPTKDQARRYVAEIEARIARGQVGIEDAAEAPTVLTKKLHAASDLLRLPVGQNVTMMISKTTIGIPMLS